MAKVEKLVNIFQKYTNPLRSLTQPEIDRLLTNARQGNDIRLQIAYVEIERNTPIFSICINKRISGVLDRSWDITTTDDSPEAKSQQEAVKKMFLKSDNKNKDGLTEAIRHLCMATFRGRSAVKPFITDDGLILKKLNNWNFISYNDKNYWNPTADYLLYKDGDLGLEQIPENEVAYIVDDKPLDWSGITIYLRQLIGEEQWARAMEKYSVPLVLLKTPEGTPDSDLDKWNYRAQAIYEGASGAMPNGTDVEVLTVARGQDPFSSYIQHQMEQFCILATGSTLATLGGTSGATGAGMGSDIASTQNDLFQSLINYDCKRIANTITSCIVKKCVKHLFGEDAEVKVKFEFVEQDNTKPEVYLDLAQKCKDIGIAVDIQKLKEITHLEFIKEDEQSVWTPERGEQ